METDRIVCAKCGAHLKNRKVKMSYLEYEFEEALPCCPNCGTVYVSEELANGKFADLEMQFEDK